MPRLRRVNKVYQLRQNTNTTKQENDSPTNATDNKRLVKVQAIPSALLRLPTELIFQVAHILAAPGLTIQRWDQPNTDLLNFSATCKSIRSITRSLLYNQLTITIEHSNPNHSLIRAIKRIKELSHPSRQISPIKKLLIKDDGPDLTNSHKTRQNWYSLLTRCLDHQLHSIQFFCYSRNLESVTESSPYEQLTIDPTIINSLSNLKHLNTLYLSGLTLEHPTSRRTTTQFKTFHNLNTLHLIAVHDSILKMIKSCHDLRELRIWRDFLTPFPSVQLWFDLQQWSSLENLKLKGLYGNSVVNLQNSLIETRQTISTTDLKINLITLDLDEPYSTNDALRLLEAFKSSSLTTLRLTVWRDEDFSPSLFERIADFFPNLEDFQVVLETPLRRWWPHKINSWAQSLSKMNRLRRFTWNCSPFTCHDLVHIQAGMKSQVMILAKLIPTLERVAYVDISGWLEIQRKPMTRRNKKASSIVQCTPGSSSSQQPSYGHVKSIRWAGVKFTYPFLGGSNGFFDTQSDSDDLLDEQESDDEEERAEDENEKVDQPAEKENWSSHEEKSRPRRRSLDDPFSVPPRSSTSSRIPNSSLTSRLTRLSSSVSLESELINKTSSHRKPSLSNPTTTTTTTTTTSNSHHHHRLRHDRLVNSHSYPDLLISQILEINRAKIPSRSHLPSDDNDDSDDLS